MGEQGSWGAGEDEHGLEPSLADVLADDRLVASVASGELTAADATDDVVALLVAWRDGVDAGAVPAHPDLDEAERALRTARERRWRMPLRLLAPVAGAAAAVGIALIGIGYAAHQATPGDPLWGVPQAIFADHSRSVQAAANVTAELAQAETAIAAGTPEQARTALDRALTDLAAVDETEGRRALERRHADLEARLDAVAPAPTSPVTTTPAPPVTTTTSPAPATSTAPSTRPAPSSTRTPDPTTAPPATTDPTPVPTTTAVPTTTDSSGPTTAPTTSETPPSDTGPAAVAPEVVTP